MSGGRALGAALALAAVLGLAGCGGVPPYGAAPRPAPAPPAAPAAAAPDTVPSADARAVLATIPEPLPPGGRIAAPAVPDTAAPVPPDSIRPGPIDSIAPSPLDTSGVDTSRSEVPVPAPTPVLGQRPLPEVLAPMDTVPPPAPPVAPAPAPVPPRASAADTCWRVQVAAHADRARAERYRNAGESQLLVPLVIEKDRTLYKVRTRDCLDGTAAENLRARARETGFPGAFRFVGRKP